MAGWTFPLQKGANRTHLNFARWLYTFCYGTGSGNFITLEGFTDGLWDFYVWVALEMRVLQHPVVKKWDCPHCMSYSFCSGNTGSACHGVLYYTRSDLMSNHFQWLLTLLFHFKPWVTEVKYSDPGLHLASKGGIQPLYAVGAAASKDIASIHTGKCLQHLVITSWGKAGFSYRFPVGPGTENTGTTVPVAENSRGCTEGDVL